MSQLLTDANIIKKLDKKDKKKISYFLELLLNQSKYEKLKKEILIRKKQIKNKEVLSHKEIWNKIDD